MKSKQRIVCTALLLTIGPQGCGRSATEVEPVPPLIVERNVVVLMRDGTELRADIYRPDVNSPLPVLLYRTPYGKHFAAAEFRTHLRATDRGYVVVLQDVRGRHASDGIFDPYKNEGSDGFDTIEWAARQSWSDGNVGTFGLSYPAAVQWLAAIESPPHLRAMAPAMTFSSPRNFFYMNGVFDLSWLPWIYFNIAPDARKRLRIDGAISDDEVAESWESNGEQILSHLPLSELPVLRAEAPFYFEWLRHPPDDDWWSWAEIRGHYERTDAAVLNLSGWYDEAYGPEGAVTNHLGIVASRPAEDSRSHLIMGPWRHGAVEANARTLGELDFGPRSGIRYDEELLRFFDHYLKNKKNGVGDAAKVRYFVMGVNEWRESDDFPPQELQPQALCLSQNGETASLGTCDTASPLNTSTFRADPQNPVTDPYRTFEAHDFAQLAERDDVLVFDSPVLTEPVTIVGNAIATMFVSCDCPDFDLWVRLLDVYPDGRAINLMSPGADVQRASYRDVAQGHKLLIPDKVYTLTIGGLLTANRFDVGHRVRIQVSASFSPHLSRNLQTGLSETASAEVRVATITIHHDPKHRSSLVLPVLP